MPSPACFADNALQVLSASRRRGLVEALLGFKGDPLAQDVHIHSVPVFKRPKRPAAVGIAHVVAWL